MNKVNFKEYSFFYNPSDEKYLMDNNSLVFFKKNNDKEIMIHFSFKDNQLVIRPRYGVTFQKIASKEYKIMMNK
ncbi:hypothetical protein DY120_01135 [Apilactobacillus micheneri]|uniref:Uncharacterized protein n=1 Tax=Apilactobacillus micheneri TaxID=1899430 RepID=A0ABY2YYC5_9LACO|nr:hypothetical protein [Apilactobacillus micheneri]TPR26330.1 hypothetical protein DY114_01135 [Apilactobacillus micheneri]TPR27084.1 hypothetical protein DY111_01135 [Apilactobacillus micheneri]TPR27942.1 hypothetical protein DY113_04910 [Apilactobacillus micheneri]TPR31847.1 hypothetical protein DY117_01135 [Apilactobacillus micheneri]TPR32251.1 hypothetical protein DY120_01135 [Apilactobacillus micheneri]